MGLLNVRYGCTKLMLSGLAVAIIYTSMPRGKALSVTALAQCLAECSPARKRNDHTKDDGSDTKDH